MDVVRDDLKKRKRRRLLAGLGGVMLFLAAGSAWLWSVDPASPSVDRSSVWIGTVERGPMEVRVRGIGSLVPEEERWIAAQSGGNVESIHLLPGAAVEPDTVLLVLHNPELRQDLRDAERQLTSAEAELANQRVREEDTLLEMEYQLAQLEASYENARLDVRMNEELFSEGLVAERDLLRSRLARDQLERQTDILGRRLANRRARIEQNLAPAIARVSQEEDRVRLLRQQVEDLRVRAGISGILQRLPLEEGQPVAPGTRLAQVADPSRLKAVIRVPETQARDIVIGQPAEIDTRNGVVSGTVARVNPTVTSGTVDVDVRLTGNLPRGARADLTVEGSIQLASMDNVLFVGRPSFARENASAGIFRLAPDGKLAERTTVRFGRSSVSTIQIMNGLQEGDRVILSDTSQYADSRRLRLN